MSINRRSFLKKAVLFGAATAIVPRARLFSANAAAFAFDPSENLLRAPRDPAQWPAFRRKLAQWRDETRRSLSYDDTLYRRPEFAWAACAFSCCFLMMCDEAFYAPRSGAYLVDDFLEHGRREFGGYDSLVLWHAYPRIGVDERNQFDFYRDMPGGLKGLRSTVETIQRRGVKVYIDYNPWDTGTRRESKADLDAVVEMVKALNVDGVFLDTMQEGPAEFRAKLDAARPGVVLEGEAALPVDRITSHHASWAQGFLGNEGNVPGVLRNKWFERRHMQHQIYRRSHDHTSELHSAWMNGSGMMIWENVFGSWYPWSPRDRSILRSLLPIQRRYSQLFASEGWTPLVPTLRDNVFASLWTQGGLRLWTLVNRANQPASGTMLQVDARPEQRYFELVAGCELKPDLSGGQAVLETVIPPRGVACFVASGSAQLGNDFEAFLAMQSATFARADFDPACPRRETRLIPVQPVFAQDQSHRGMVVVRARPTERLAIQIRSRECGFYESEPPEGWPQHIYDFQTRTFDRVVQMRPYCIDETPVTNAQYAEFLRATGYYPKHPENFLRHWTGGLPPAGMEEHPVVWVDLDDARSYAKWATKRLPTEEEWQLAAGGNEYPWGNGVRAGCCNLGETGGTTAVKAFPAGRSPWGCYDMCGNVWQWTESERTDGRTRFCMIRGGSYFAAEGSNWYVEGGPRPVSSATKFLLMWPGLDRCATIGFRCAADLKA